MKYARLPGIIYIALLFSSCGKGDSGSISNTTVSGQWAFTSQYARSFAYPTVLTNPMPFSISNWSLSNDSIKVNFDNNGNYSFSNYSLPTQTGKFSIVHDTILLIKPDTSAFIKFCYSTQTFYTGSTTLPAPPPYANFHFTSDSISFKKDGNNIIFTTYWFDKAAYPIQPNSDTLELMQAITTFKKL